MHDQLEVINNYYFDLLLAAAQSKTQTSIYSPPFYSSGTGYKMCLRLHLNGDGYAEQTHMSLFFLLMRGEYDAILKFPFCFKVAFCLYDLTDKQDHIIGMFRPDVRSSNSQRPRSDMNIVGGLPNFAPVTIFQQENNSYVCDNTMFIKAIVDFSNSDEATLSSLFRLRL